MTDGTEQTTLGGPAAVREGGVPDWLVVMIVTRDGLIVGAIVLSSLMGSVLEMKPLFVSKANTTAPGCSGGSRITID